MRYLLSLTCLLFSAIGYAGAVDGGGYGPTPYVLSDIDRDGILNAQDNDLDGDGVSNDQDRVPFATDSFYCDGGMCVFDNCPALFNIQQEDRDHDGVGDVCDIAPDTYNPRYDHNCDGKINTSSPQVELGIVEAVVSVCPNLVQVLPPPPAPVVEEDDSGADQPADPALDWDDDGLDNDHDNCLQTPNPDQADADTDGVGDECDSSAQGSSNKDASSNENNGLTGEESSSCMSLSRGPATFGVALFPWTLSLAFLLALRSTIRRSRE